MRPTLKAHLLFFIMSISFSTSASESINGEKLFQEKCSDCHQQDGNSTDNDIPHIAGFSAILTFDILDQFKSGDRKSIPINPQKVENNPNKAHDNNSKNSIETDMNVIAKSLKTKEIEALSLFLANQTFKPTTQKYDPKLAETGKMIHLDLCENCHVDQGSGKIEDASLLKGQWKQYLQRQFKALSKGERYMPRRMKKRFRKLSEEDKEALIEFYISPMKNKSDKTIPANEST